MFDNKPNQTHTPSSKIPRLATLFQQLAHIRNFIQDRFPIPTVRDASQLQPEEGMLIIGTNLDCAVTYTLAYPSGFSAPTEHEEPILVTFLLQGYVSNTYRTPESLENEGHRPDNQRIVLGVSSISWSYFKEEQLDEMIWKMEQEVNHWNEKLRGVEYEMFHSDPPPASQRMRELAFALEKLEAIQPTNPFLSVMDQTAQVFLEKVNKQFEQALLKKERDGNQA